MCQLFQVSRGFDLCFRPISFAEDPDLVTGLYPSDCCIMVFYSGINTGPDYLPCSKSSRSPDVKEQIFMQSKPEIFMHFIQGVFITYMGF